MLRPIILSALVLAAAAAAEYRIPKKWIGKEDGKSDGNPAQVDGKDRWRLDGQVAGDLLSASSWKPLIWGAEKTRWNGEKGGGGFLWKDGDMLLRMGGGDEKAPSSAALVFLAPAAGTYQLKMNASGSPWEKATVPEKLLILKRAKGEAKLVKVSEPAFSGEKPEVSVQAELAEGDELVITAGPLGRKNQFNLRLDALVISGP